MSRIPKPLGGRPARISVEINGYKVKIDPPQPEAPQSNSDVPNSHFRHLTPFTLPIVRLLCGRGWMTRQEIARELGENPEGDIRPLLTDLAKRGLLESSGNKGYHVALPPDQEPEQYRRQLAEWLDRQADNMPDEKS